MNKQQLLKAASDFLKEYSDNLLYDGCNDFDLDYTCPTWEDKMKFWEDKMKFVEDYHRWNGDYYSWLKENNDSNEPDYTLPDFVVVAFIAHLLEKEANK